MTPKGFLTPAEAARILGTVPATVRQMAREGKLEVAATTEGGNRLFDRKAVEALHAKRYERKGTPTRDPRAE